MKIAFTATGDTLEDQVAFRMGRNAFYLIVDTDSMEVEPIENPDRVHNVEVSEQCAGLMRDRGVRAVVTGHCGPSAHKIFAHSGISVLPGISGPMTEFVDAYRRAPDLFDIPAEPLSPTRPGSKRAGRGKASYEDYLQLKAEVVVMQRKLLDLQRRVATLENR